MRIFWLIPFLLFSCATSQQIKGKKGLFQEWVPPSQRSEAQNYCEPLNAEARQELLSIADPANFPRTRYRLGSWRAIEKETDCSRFVHEIYKRAGFPFGFRSSRELKYAPEFQTIDAEEALPGDLMVFRGHVGIVDQEGRIISATRNRRRQPSAITVMPPTNFKSPRGGVYALRYRCEPGFEPVAHKPVMPVIRATASKPKRVKKKRKRHQPKIQIELSSR